MSLTGPLLTGTGWCRFPSDSTDRYWLPEGPNSNLLQSTAALQILTTNNTVFNFSYNFNDRTSQPPSTVMQTAITTTNQMTVNLGEVSNALFHLNLYFAELDPHPNVTSRLFGVNVPNTYDDNTLYTPIQLDLFNTSPPTPFIVDYETWGSYEAYSYVNKEVLDNVTAVMTIELYPLAGTSMGPLLNGLEYYDIIPVLNWTLLVTNQEGESPRACDSDNSSLDYALHASYVIKQML